MRNNISQRDAFWNKVYELAKDDKDIVIISADMGAPALDRIRKELAHQFVNAGIAEQNATTLAAGLSLSGKKVFTYAIAPFITLRCLEQIRVAGAMMKIPITIVGVGAGFGYEDSGPTHHLIEDIAVMRAMPNIKIFSITDNSMAEYVARRACEDKRGSIYVRLERLSYFDIYDKSSDFSKGLAVLRKARNYLISTGSITHAALEIIKELADEGVDLGLIDLFEFPVNGYELLLCLKGAKRIFTLEEHFLAGGLGSAVCEVLADHGLMVPIKRLGIPMERGYCYKYGGREAIRGYYDIDKDSIKTKIKNCLLNIQE